MTLILRGSPFPSLPPSHLPSSLLPSLPPLFPPFLLLSLLLSFLFFPPTPPSLPASLLHPISLSPIPAGGADTAGTGETQSPVSGLLVPLLRLQLAQGGGGPQVRGGKIWAVRRRPPRQGTGKASVCGWEGGGKGLHQRPALCPVLRCQELAQSLTLLHSLRVDDHPTLHGCRRQAADPDLNPQGLFHASGDLGIGYRVCWGRRPGGPGWEPDQRTGGSQGGPAACHRVENMWGQKRGP